jgi:hypothetical protein
LAQIANPDPSVLQRHQRTEKITRLLDYPYRDLSVCLRVA